MMKLCWSCTDASLEVAQPFNIVLSLERSLHDGHKHALHPEMSYHMHDGPMKDNCMKREILVESHKFAMSNAPYGIGHMLCPAQFCSFLMQPE